MPERLLRGLDLDAALRAVRWMWGGHEAREIRQQVLGTLQHPPAMTVVITGIFDEAWLLEIEAIAA